MPRPLSSFGPLVVRSLRVDTESWAAFEALRARKAMSWPAFVRWVLSVVEATP